MNKLGDHLPVSSIRSPPTTPTPQSDLQAPAQAASSSAISPAPPAPEGSPELLIPSGPLPRSIDIRLSQRGTLHRERPSPHHTPLAEQSRRLYTPHRGRAPRTRVFVEASLAPGVLGSCYRAGIEHTYAGFPKVEVKRGPTTALPLSFSLYLSMPPDTCDSISLHTSVASWSDL
jgi:hypothetical protein